MQNAFADMNIPHFFRFLLLNTLVWLSSMLVIPYFIWQGYILDRTGYRKIDLLWFFFPAGAAIVFTRTQWRYCSKTCYWETAVPVTPAPVTVAA